MDVEALLAEREGYKRRGLKERVAQVDVAIKSLGLVVSDEPVAEAAPELETADATPTKRRKS